MITKHFLKTLILFMVIILLGLLSLFLISYFGEQEREGLSGNALQGYEYLEVVAD